MAGQKGFLYEGRVFNKLKSKNLVPRGVRPAGANPNLPDAVFLYNNQSHNLEVKLDLATDFGDALGVLNAVAGCGDATKGIMAGGEAGGTSVNII